MPAEERDDGLGGFFSSLATVLAPQNSYSDTTVVVGLTYRYRLRARNAQSVSNYGRVTPGALSLLGL